MKKVNEVKTIKEGMQSKQSFVIRGLNLPCDLNICKDRAAKKDKELFGYGEGGKMIMMMASKALAKYEKGTLGINIVDAPFPVLLDKQIPETLLKASKKSRMGIHMTLTRKGSYTPLHTDPDRGGGWMYLNEGIKLWQLIPSIYLDQFKGTGKTWVDDLQDPPKNYHSEILYETTIKGGDFIYFPPMTMHRVWTFENSFGVSGYAKFY